MPEEHVTAVAVQRLSHIEVFSNLTLVDDGRLNVLAATKARGLDRAQEVASLYGLVAS